MPKFKTTVHAQEYIMYYLTNNSTINKFYCFTIYLRQILTEISPGLVYRFFRFLALLPNVILARLYPPLIDLDLDLDKNTGVYIFWTATPLKH